MVIAVIAAVEGVEAQEAIVVNTDAAREGIRKVVWERLDSNLTSAVGTVVVEAQLRDRRMIAGMIAGTPSAGTTLEVLRRRKGPGRSRVNGCENRWCNVTRLHANV